MTVTMFKEIIHIFVDYSISSITKIMKHLSIQAYIS